MYSVNSENTMNDLIVAYNNLARKMPLCSAIVDMCVENAIPSFGELQRKTVFGLKNRIEKSSNTVSDEVKLLDIQQIS